MPYGNAIMAAAATTTNPTTNAAGQQNTLPLYHLNATEKALISVLSIATAIRLLLSYVFFSSDATTDAYDDVLAQSLGPGILPAMRAAILDPAHTWGHLQEACFWLENGPSMWTEARGGGDDNSGIVGYSAIYTPGTRIVAPPLVVAFLGETLVCSGATYLGIIRTLLLLVADGIGAYCLYHLGKRIFEFENRSNEAEIERHTKLSESKKDIDDDLVVPGVLRPERGWTVGLPSKINPPEECLPDGSVKDNGASADINQNKGNKNDEGSKNIDNTTSSTLLVREQIFSLDQLPLVACILYYCNPISMLANANGSLRSLWDALLLLSLYYTTMPPTTITNEGIPIKVPTASKAAISLALATYADAGYAVFLLPILLWRGLFRCAKTPTSIQKAQHHDWKMFLALNATYLVGLHYFASLLVGDDPSVYRQVMVQTILPNVAFIQQDVSGSVPGPCMGLHWYMFVQMFDRFRPYFTVFVGGIPVMFAVPLMTRLYRYPSVLVATFQLLWAIFRPTTTVHTLTFGLLLAFLNPRTIVRMRDPSLIAFFALPVPILLFVTFHRMWLVTGNGNPNYIYFQCFAYGMFVTIISMEFVSATVKRDKVRRMVEKGSIKKILIEKEKKKEEQSQTKVDDAGEHNGVNEVGKEGNEKGQNGNLEEENGGKDDMSEEVIEDEGGISDQMNDGGDQPEPAVVFI